MDLLCALLELIQTAANLVGFQGLTVCFIVCYCTYCRVFVVCWLFACMVVVLLLISLFPLI